WAAWRSESPLHGERPGKPDLAHAMASGHGREDVLPYPSDAKCAGLLRLLVVGINPSPWTAAVNAPFARPGNRFWVSLAAAGILDATIDASRGLSHADERLLAERGIGITNLVSRPTARADELSAAELRPAGVNSSPGSLCYGQWRSRSSASRRFARRSTHPGAHSVGSLLTPFLAGLRKSSSGYCQIRAVSTHMRTSPPSLRNGRTYGPRAHPDAAATPAQMLRIFLRGAHQTQPPGESGRRRTWPRRDARRCASLPRF